MSSPDVSVILITWNVKRYLLNCLAALPSSLAGLQYDIIVVDNASTDGTAEAVLSQYPHVEVIRNRENRFYTVAANQGLAAAQGRHQILLNPDTTPQPGSLALLCQYADDHPDAGLVGPRLIDGAGHIDFRTGRDLPTLWSELAAWSGIARRLPGRWRDWNLRLEFDRYQVSNVPLLSGACLLLSARLPDDLRRLDETYPMYGEDVDLTRRVQAAGFTSVLMGEACVIHQGGASSSLRPVHSALMSIAAMNHYLRQYHGILAAILHRLGMMGISACKVLYYRLRQHLSLTGIQAEDRVRVYTALLQWTLQPRSLPDAVRPPEIWDKNHHPLYE